MSLTKALELFKQKYPALIVTAAYLYDKKYFMFTATPDTKITVINSPYYLVDVKGNVFNITPTLNIDAFNDALEKHQLKLPETSK